MIIKEILVKYKINLSKFWGFLWKTFKKVKDPGSWICQLIVRFCLKCLYSFFFSFICFKAIAWTIKGIAGSFLSFLIFCFLRVLKFLCDSLFSVLFLSADLAPFESKFTQIGRKFFQIHIFVVLDSLLSWRKHIGIFSFGCSCFCSSRMFSRVLSWP